MSQKEPNQYKPKNKIRFVTATSLFDGHDATINIMRRIIQSSGAEVIHLGHNRSAAEIVDTAIQEDAHAIAVTCYQGGHLEFFQYIYDLLQKRGAPWIKIFGGGGGVIVPEEMEQLHQAGINRIFSPEDGRKMGLQGMIDYMLKECDYSMTSQGRQLLPAIKKGGVKEIARAITLAEEAAEDFTTEGRESQTTARPETEDASNQLPKIFAAARENSAIIPVVGITGTGGAGKSSLTDELVRRFLAQFPDKKLGILSVDPSRRRTGGALLGDRIRMNAVATSEAEGNTRVYMRSLATRRTNSATSRALQDGILILKAAGFDLILVETAGIGQSDTEIVDLVDFSLYVMTSDYGASTQLEKIDMLDLADMIVLNKFEKQGAQDALRDVRKQYQRNHQLFEVQAEDLPVFPTIASQFNDPGVNYFFYHLFAKVGEKTGLTWINPLAVEREEPGKNAIIPPERQQYLTRIADNAFKYRQRVEKQEHYARRAFQIQGSIDALTEASSRQELHIGAGDQVGEGSVEIRKREVPPQMLDILTAERDFYLNRLEPQCRELLEKWEDAKKAYSQDKMVTRIRDKEIVNHLSSTSLSGTRIPRVSMPSFQDWGERLKWMLLENVPGAFPYTAGVFPFKRLNEDPTRMFAGEGTPERTNQRFHYLSRGLPAKRLSTAFDSVTLYGEDPHQRPDIYGKIGNSGVSVCTLDDAKKLYCGFDLCHPATSVSMTINGPAPIMLAFFLNTAIDQQVEKVLRQEGKWEQAREKIIDLFRQKEMIPPTYRGNIEPREERAFGLGTLGVCSDQLIDQERYNQIKEKTLQVVRGTVQADILKEDQAQNTCIFSSEFALRMMGDIQQYFIQQQVRNYYSVSISGYHIAEAGANPITQAALTLANGFTYMEYYLSRGMPIDSFAPNLSFFFSNGIDPEYAVIGRVARRIWSVAMRYYYKGNGRSQKLKYHIQTSGRSLHMQEIDFNDIRTTLQALYAIYDNCNSLHTNAYDEAVTTPTEESVRRAMAIQLIINREYGLAKNENPLQGSFMIDELTDLVEEAILTEFKSISRRGGVLGAMETMYQRGKIQEESLYYEELKHSGQYPIIGVNTFLRPQHLEDQECEPMELIRSTQEEKDQQIDNLRAFQRFNLQQAEASLAEVTRTAQTGGNLFEVILEAAKYCSLGQLTGVLYRVGGWYRRNM